MKSKNLNLTKFIFFWWVAIALIGGLFALVKGISKLSAEYKETKAIRQEEQRLDWILEEINSLYILNDEYTKQRNELEAQQTEIHNSAEENRTEITRLRNEYYKWTDDEHVMELICKEVENSPLCWNYTLLNKLKEIADKRNVDYKLLLGIMYHESKLGTAFSPSYECSKSNNWWWVKARKYDDGSVSEWFDKQENRIPWCWLYNFDTVEEFFESLANTISLGYWKCLERKEAVSCICNIYVGKYSQARVDSVRRFADYEFIS